MSDKISYSEYLELFQKDEVDDADIAKYSTIYSSGGLQNIRIGPDPDKVVVPAEELALFQESGMTLGNGLYRWLNYKRYIKRVEKQPNVRRILCEGDSWCQYPMLIKEISDQLCHGYAVRNIAAAGDRLDNMVGKNIGRKKNEMFNELRNMGNKVSAVIFSGAGNDVIGEMEDERSGEKVSALFNILKPYNKNNQSVEAHINEEVFQERLLGLRRGYQKMISGVHMIPGLEELPILIHGYANVFPFPFPAAEGEKDERKPPFFYARPDEWLGEPLIARDIPFELGHKILIHLIGRLYKMLDEIASQQNNVFVVDCRPAVTSVNDWFDEIHPRSEVFARIASLFQKVLTDQGVVPLDPPS